MFEASLLISPLIVICSASAPEYGASDSPSSEINTFTKTGRGSPLWLTNCYKRVSRLAAWSHQHTRYVGSTYLLYLPLLRKHRGGVGILPILELTSHPPILFRFNHFQEPILQPFCFHIHPGMGRVEGGTTVVFLKQNFRSQPISMNSSHLFKVHGAERSGQSEAAKTQASFLLRTEKLRTVN
jgi:hypothetical protein